jgi:hypothetical protein
MDPRARRGSKKWYLENRQGFLALNPLHVALREGDRIEETLATENEGKVLIRARAPAHVHSAHAAFFAAGVQLAAHTQPALRNGLMAPA